MCGRTRKDRSQYDTAGVCSPARAEETGVTQMTRLARRLLASRRKALIAAAVPLLAAGLTCAATVQASAAPRASAHHAAIIPAVTCSNAGDLCFWVNANGGGAKGLLAGSNGN